MSCSYKEESYSRMLSKEARPMFFCMRQHFHNTKLPFYLTLMEGGRIWSTGKAIHQSKAFRRDTELAG